MNRSVRFNLVLIAALAFSLPAFAYWTPLQINLVDVVGLPPAAESVYGIRANLLYEYCDDAAGLDLGLVNRTKECVCGIRAAVINGADTDAYGLSVGLMNLDLHNSGLAAGFYNYAEQGAGVQIGVFNVVNKYAGVQLGLLNFNFNSIIPVCPIINISTGD